MDTIELWNGVSKAIVSREGGWLTNLSDNNGDILFSKRQLAAADGNKRARGGCHVCLPNFGPGGNSGLLQHGFGRVSVWNITERGQSSVKLELRSGAGGYESLLCQLVYTLNETSLALTLVTKNLGNKPLRVAPAFHPYFALTPSEGQVTIDDQKYDLTDLIDTVFMEGTSKTLDTQLRHFSLQSDDLTTWAAWTDRLGQYVCVEPTFGGYTFLEATPEEGELLQPGLNKTYRATISW